MKFYTSIAGYYDEIFPYNPAQKQFVESFDAGGNGSAVLDIGCGTGNLILNLAGSFDTLIGIDPDKEMLRLARLKALGFKAERREEAEWLGNWVFLPKGMLDLRSEFVPGSFSSVLCFGNTLVHLSSLKEIRMFAVQAFEILKPGGYLMIQLINYDRIVDLGLKGLPSIENEKIKFERIYSYDPEPAKINFQTRLTVKNSGEVIENEIHLLALRPGQLKGIIKETGFTGLQEFGSFGKDPFNMDSQPYIITALK